MSGQRVPRTRPALLTLLVALAATTLSAQRPGVTSGITVCEDVEFGGTFATFVRDVPDLRPVGLEHRVSSFLIARGEVWEICEGRDYSGRCESFSGDERDLVRLGWNDKVSSLRRLRGDRNPRPSGWHLELYAGLKFTGQRVVFDLPNPDLSKIRYNDRAMSARVPDGQTWELCVNAGYRDCRVVDHDIPDLNAIGISRLISSVRPRFNPRGR
ncbi:MAG TPA: beta/gamma crystallin-related protein [Vicinamibacterales bacterium]|nr:beta/gamma crystallin-related protein [Vicinamibacterales bacterium]